ncbi:MAG: hypothetical protein GWN58_52925, partial [Anaerolineae bacterium]|nr:hypothetical protein [Anaerolineae bacterium]
MPSYDPYSVTQPQSKGTPPGDGRPGLWRRLRWFLLAFVIVVGLAAAAGYFSGVQARDTAQAEQAREQAAHQFELGLADMEAGEYERARQRFEYIISI